MSFQLEIYQHVFLKKKDYLLIKTKSQFHYYIYPLNITKYLVHV